MSIKTPEDPIILNDPKQKIHGTKFQFNLHIFQDDYDSSSMSKTKQQVEDCGYSESQKHTVVDMRGKYDLYENTLCYVCKFKNR